MKFGEESQRLRDAIAPAFATCDSLEMCAQLFTRRIYEEYAQSAVLVRLFATLRFEQLQSKDRSIARDFAEQLDPGTHISDSSHVLTLLGTYGVEPRWRKRTLSRGHRAIPLLSHMFVAEIPMIARLLGEIGFDELGRSNSAWQYVRRVAGDSGLFFVGDARTATDERGRRIIPATDFIDAHNVRTVFGFGSPGADAASFIAVIVFSRDTLLRSDAQRFATFDETLRVAAAPFVESGAIFSSRDGRRPEPR